MPAIRMLLREYAASLPVDLAYQDFEDELRALPGAYAPPGGQLLIAHMVHVDAHEVAGMGAFRAAANGDCEMKRLFVRSAARGFGLGGALVRRLMTDAAARGYRRMVLDTLPTMLDAQRLYVALGFCDVAAYYESPVSGTRFMAVDLTDPATSDGDAAS